MFLENKSLCKASLSLSTSVQPRELCFHQPNAYLVCISPAHRPRDCRSHSWLLSLLNPNVVSTSLTVDVCNTILQCILCWIFMAIFPFNWQHILAVLGFIFKLISYIIRPYSSLPHNSVLVECKISLVSVSLQFSIAMGWISYFSFVFYISPVTVALNIK